MRTRDVAKNRFGKLRSGDKAIFVCLYLFLFVLIVSGNALTFRVAGRVAVKLSDLMALLVGIILLRSFITGKIDRPLGLILLWGLWSLLLIVLSIFIYGFGAGEIVTGLLYLVRFVYMCWLGKIAADWLRKRGLAIYTLQFINLLYLITCVLGFLQLYFFPVAYDFYDIFYRIGVYFPNPDPHVNRVISTYFDPNYFASCLLIGFCISLYLIGRSHEDRAPTLRYYVSLAVYLVTILLTRSRSGILGCAILLFVYLLLAFRKKKMQKWQIALLVALCVGAVCMFLFSNISVFVRIRNVFSDPSAFARFASWGRALDIIVDTGFMGIGYNLYGAYTSLQSGGVIADTAYGNDSSLLLTAITTGIVGLVLFVMHFYYMFSHKRAPKCAVALFLAAIVISNFNNLLFYNLWVFPFYFVMALMRNPEKGQEVPPKGESV